MSIRLIILGLLISAGLSGQLNDPHYASYGGQPTRIPGIGMLIAQAHDMPGYVPPGPDGIWYELANDLYVTVPEGMTIGDRVLECTPNRQWFEQTGYEWEKTGGSNDFGFYGTDSILIPLTTLTAGSYEITYKLSDGIVYDMATIYITVTPSANNRFIDFGYTGTESGTMTQPWNSFSDFTFADNLNYFVKRGETLNFASYVDMTNLDYVYLGAYGAGERPRLVTSYPGTGSGPGTIDITACNYTTIQSLYVENTAGNTQSYLDNCDAVVWFGGSFANLYINGNCTHVWVDNCVMQGSDYNHLTYNAVRIVGGARSGGGIRNCEIAWSLHDGIYGLNSHGTSMSDRYWLVSNYIHHIQNSSLLNPTHVSCSSAGDCIDFMGYDEGGHNAGSSQYTWIAFNRCDRSNSIYKHGIKYGNDPTICDTDITHTIIEHNIVIGFAGLDTKGQNNYSLYYARGTISRWNVSIQGTCALWYPVEYDYQQFDPDNNDTQIYGWLIINPGHRAFFLNGNTDGSMFWNNTVIMTDVDANYTTLIDVQCMMWSNSAANDIDVQNNIFYLNDPDIDYGIRDDNGSGGVNEANNMWLNSYGWTIGPGSVIADPGFVSGYTPWGPYEINSSSPAYHEGVDVGLTEDGWGTDYGSTPSYGFKEVD